MGRGPLPDWTRTAARWAADAVGRTVSRTRHRVLDFSQQRVKRLRAVLGTTKQNPRVRSSRKVSDSHPEPAMARFLALLSFLSMSAYAQLPPSAPRWQSSALQQTRIVGNGSTLFSLASEYVTTRKQGECRQGATTPRFTPETSAETRFSNPYERGKSC